MEDIAPGIISRRLKKADREGSDRCVMDRDDDDKARPAPSPRRRGVRCAGIDHNEPRNEERRSGRARGPKRSPTKFRRLTGVRLRGSGPTSLGRITPTPSPMVTDGGAAVSTLTSAPSRSHRSFIASRHRRQKQPGTYGRQSFEAAHVRSVASFQTG